MWAACATEVDEPVLLPGNIELKHGIAAVVVAILIFTVSHNPTLALIIAGAIVGWSAYKNGIGKPGWCRHMLHWSQLWFPLKGFQPPVTLTYDVFFVERN